MKKHLPLLILTLFLGGCAPTSPNLGVAVPPPALPEDGIKHTLISESDTQYEGVITEGTKEKGRGIFIATVGQAKGNWYEGEFLGTNFYGEGKMRVKSTIAIYGDSD